MSSYLSSLLSNAFGTGAAMDSSDSEGENDTAMANTSSSGNAAVAAGKKSAVSSSSGRCSSSKTDATSVHWLGVETDEKEVRVVCDPKAAKEVLCKVEGPLNLISIFGGARQGKSFLMNTLAGEDGLFRISSSQDPCTQGVDLSRKVLSWGAFHHRDEIAMKKHEKKSLARASSEPAPRIAFVDCEGQGDRDVVYDANLVCPLALTSRSILFNVKDSLQKDKLLNQLGVMQRAAFNVATEEEEEEGGAAAPKVFGHLHIVFRDWNYDGTKESVYKTLFTQERSNAPDALARNQIRTVLENSFESISIWLLPPPVEKTTDLNKELREGDLSAAFKTQVEELRHALAEQAKTPHHFCGKVLTGPKIASLVPAIVQTLNSGDQVMPRSAYASLVAAEVTRVQATYLKRLQKALAAVKAEATNAPVTTSKLKTQLLGEIHDLQRDFDRWLHSLGDEAAADEAATAFHEHCSKGKEEIIAFNRAHLLVAHLHAAGKRAQAAFDAAFTATVEARLPMAPERLVGEYQTALSAAEATVRGVVVGEVETADLPLADILGTVRTHAALSLAKVEQLNKQKLASVQKQEVAAYEQAKTTFQETFFGALSSLKAGGQPIAEVVFGKQYDAALATAKKALASALHAELTTPARAQELEGFLVNACDGVKGEQGAMYQVQCTKVLLAEAQEAATGKVRALETKVAEQEAELEKLRKEHKSTKAALHSLVGESKSEIGKWHGKELEWTQEKFFLTKERDALKQQVAQLTREKEALQQEVGQASKKRKAAEDEVERAVKAQRLAEETAAASAASAAASAAAAAAAAQQAKVEAEEQEEEEEEDERMEDNVKEDLPAPAPTATKPKGRAGKGRVSSAAAAKPALSASDQRKLIEQAREEERKRIEESTAKRITRTRK